MPTFRHGRGTKVLVGGYDLTSMFREAQIQRSMDTAETTAFGSTVKSYVPGMIDANVSLSGMFSAGASDVDPVLNNIFGSSTTSPVTVMYDNPGTGSGMVAGQRSNLGEGYESSYGVSGSVGDMVAISAEVKPTLGFIGGWSLQDITSQTPGTANGTTVDLDNGMGLTWPLTTAKFFANIHVTANTLSGAGNIAMVIEHSAASNMSGAATILTPTTLLSSSGVYGETKRVTVNTTLNRYVRIRYTYSVTLTGNFTLHASFGYHY